MGILAAAMLLAVIGAAAAADGWDDSDADAGSSPAICTLTINPGTHGTGNALTWKVLAGNSVELPTSAFAADSGKYYLAGYSASSGGSAAYSAGQSLKITADTNLWAVWSEPEDYDYLQSDPNAPASGTADATWSYEPISKGTYSGGNPGMWAAMAEALSYSHGLAVDSMPDWMTMTHSESWNKVSFRGSPTGPGVWLVQVHDEHTGKFSIWWTVTVKASSDSTHALTFSAGSGSGSYSVPRGAEGTCTVLPASGFTKAGSTLAAWSTQISGQTVYYPLSAVYTFTDRDAVMTAYYAPDQGVLVFDAAGGISASGAQAYIVQSGGVVTLPASGYTMPGHTLIGWRYSNEPSGAVYAPGYQLPVAAATPSNSMSAVWAPDSAGLVKVTFGPNGGTAGGPGSVSAPAGTKIALPAVGLTKAGYTFRGWNTEADGSGDAYDGGAAYTVGSSPSSVYAVWTAAAASDTHTVSFLLNGGRGTVPPQSVPNGSLASKPADPTLDGYLFKGWQQLGGSAGLFDFSTPITSDVFLRAIWQRAIQVSVEGLTVGVSIDQSAPGTGYAQILWGDGSPAQAFYRQTTKAMAAGSSGTLTVTLSTGQKISAPWSVSSSAAADFTVTVMDGGTVYKAYKVASGGELSKSAVLKDLARAGKTVSLSTDKAGENEYEWGAVTGDLTLYAHWSDSSDADMTLWAAAAAICAVLAAVGYIYTRSPSVLGLTIALAAAAALMWVI
jgi:hypothetical protein